MSIPNKQIGWSQESNLLWNISSQLDRLTKVISNFAPPGANIYNSDGVLTGNRTLSGASNDLTFADLRVLKTISGSSVIGLNLDFLSNIYELGDSQNQFVVSLDRTNRSIYLGDLNSNNNGTAFDLNDVAQNIQTVNQGNVKGLKLDFANSVYFIGDTNFGNLTNVLIDDTLRVINVDALNDIVIGDCVGNQNNTKFIINDTNEIIKTEYQGNDIGLKLDFANTKYQLGQLIGGNNNFLEIDDTNERLFYQNLIAGKIGLYIDLINNSGFIGDGNGYSTGGFIAYSQTNAQICGGTNNNIRLNVDDFNNLIETTNGNNQIGLKLDFATRLYQYGQITGSNQTTITIDDAAAYPVQVAGTNISSGTAGAASGQFLKIKVGGVDYKIALLNP